MTGLNLIFLLAAAALAAFSVQARKTSTFHTTTATFPFSHRIHVIRGHLPPSSAIGLHSVHQAAAPSGSKLKQTPNAAAPSSGSKKHASYAAAPSPAYQDYSLLRDPFAGFYECLERVTEECGLEIYRGIFEKGGVSTRCCGQLVGLGRRCHDGIVEATLGLPELQAANIDKKEIKARDHKIWSQCVFITNHKVVDSDRLPILP
ncbi:hypothetical protein CDL12_18467 [Handroanthus impetiginosus]|uniref:Prolamin-like domain-containing protein n=1 Tax=Handroanthus impetiginosus TaxID=429701 RepID=A0A2G9GUJ1_9LAMI|nr:hypothetical protein CDL12_18467 [Handroanthus impetiginosus]